MYDQLTIFDWMPEACPEPEVGDYLEDCGPVICRIMRPSYIGRKVLIDVSTCGHVWYQVGILEKVIEHEGHERSIVFVGQRQRKLIDHVPWNGAEIYEVRKRR